MDITEFNPFETIETNIQGTMNMIKSAMKHNPKQFINISTDKAVSPSTLYGSTKQIGEKLIHWAFIIAPHNYEGLRLKLHIGEYAERMAKKLNQNKDE